MLGCKKISVAFRQINSSGIRCQLPRVPAMNE
jgi:hypothetical protein